MVAIKKLYTDPNIGQFNGKYVEIVSDCSYIIHNSNATDAFSSLYINSTNQHVSYLTTSGLIYKSSSSLYPTTTADWNISYTIDANATSTNGANINLTGDSNKLYLSYYDNLNATLKYAYSNSLSPTDVNAWTITTVGNSLTNIGKFNSLAINSTTPYISFYDETNKDLKLAYSTKLNPTSTEWTILSPDPYQDRGKYSNIVVNTERIYISYGDTDTNNLRFTFSNNLLPENENDWYRYILRFSPQASLYTSLVYHNDNIYISYYDPLSMDLKIIYSKKKEPNRIEDWVDISVDTPGDVGEYTSLAITQNRLFITYHDSTENNFNIAYSNDLYPTISDNWKLLTVDNPTGINAGKYSSLHTVDYNPSTDKGVIYATYNYGDSIKHISLDALNKNKVAKNNTLTNINTASTYPPYNNFTSCLIARLKD